MTTAYEALLQRAGDTVTSRGPRESMVRCPCLDHDDSTASLHVSVGDRACAVVWCHAECSTPDVMAAWGLPEAALYDAYWNRSNGNGPQKVWIYTDETGEPLFEVGRFAGKKFLQRSPGKTDWKGGIKGVRRVLYRLPEVIAAAQAGRVVFVVEGEKDADALRLAGEVATTSPAGAGKWRQEYAESLRGARVVVVADKDDPGRKHAQRVAASLNGVASDVTVVEALEGKDASDHLDAGHSVGAFVKVAVADEPETGPKPAVKHRKRARCSRRSGSSSLASSFCQDRRNTELSRCSRRTPGHSRRHTPRRTSSWSLPRSSPARHGYSKS